MPLFRQSSRLVSKSAGNPSPITLKGELPESRVEAKSHSDTAGLSLPAPFAKNRSLRHRSPLVSRRTGAVAVAALFAGLLVVPAGSAAAPASQLSAAAEQGDPADPTVVLIAAEDAASVLAKDSGEPVVVDEATTETTMVTANPDGTFTSKTSTEPVRVKKPQGWVDVDPALQADPDGTVRPAATSLDMAFSGGGSGPLATLTDPDGNQLEYSWPGKLPAPVLAGATATYPEVLPDVDLVVTADVESFTQVLVVKTAEAAANPDLDSFDIALAADGLTILQNTNGNVQAVNDAGDIQFQSKTPAMWDSTHDPEAGTAPTESGPGTGQVTPLPSDVTLTETGDEATITVTPDEKALTGNDVVYPVYIDPTMTATSFKYRVIFNSAGNDYGGTDSADDPDARFVVGCAQDCGAKGEARTFFTIDTTPLTGRPTVAVVDNARVFVRQMWNGNPCNDTDVELMSTSGAFNHLATPWPGPVAGTGVLATGTSGAGTNCLATKPPANVVFADTLYDDTPQHGNQELHALTGYFQHAADVDSAWTDFYLRAPGGDTGALAGKEFDPHVYVELTYGFPTDVPQARGIMESTTCPAGTGTVTTTDSTPELVGRVSGNNAAPYLDVTAQVMFFVYLPGTTAPIRTSPWINTRTETDAKWSVTPVLPDGAYTYNVKARAYPDSGPLNESTYSNNVPFNLNIGGLLRPNIVHSFDYPEDAWGAPANHPGTISLAYSGLVVPTAYAYSWYSEASIPRVPNTTCPPLATTTSQGGIIAADSAGKAELAVPANLPPGPKTLYFKSTNATRGQSPVSTYDFLISPDATTNGRIEAEDVTAVQTLGTYTNSLVYRSAPADASGTAGKAFHATGGNATTGPAIGLPFTITTAGNYALGIALYKAKHHGTLQFELVSPSGAVTILKDPNNPTVNLTFDGYKATGERIYLPLGGRNFITGSWQLRIRVTGKNPASTGVVYSGVNDNGYGAALDLFTVMPFN